MKRLPAIEAEHEGNPLTIHLAFRQHLRLAVADRLQRMLGVAEEFVAFTQLVDGCRRQIALPCQRRQYLEQRPLLQTEISPAVNQLKRLSDELHLANAAGAQL